jgi:membrane protein
MKLFTRERASSSTLKGERLERLRTLPFVGLVLRWLRKTTQVAMMDRGMALAAQFVASLIPLLIVLATVAPEKTSSTFWNSLARWLGLRGAEANTVKQLIGVGGQVNVDTSWFGAFILIISAFSFIRALQRAYEQVWELKPLSFKNFPRQFLWLATFLSILFMGYLFRLLAFHFLPVTVTLVVVFIVVGLGFWWLTPYLLLGGRVSLRRLLPGAVVSGIAVVAYMGSSPVYMPGRIEASAHQFGPLGLIFIILSWYFILFCILIAGAALGPVLLEVDNPLSRYMRGADAVEAPAPASEREAEPYLESTRR